tara:strand:- start:345 stop:563 length:219 start_codon:yes stop_codon:yes gene_type:complete
MIGPVVSPAAPLESGPVASGAGPVEPLPSPTQEPESGPVASGLSTGPVASGPEASGPEGELPLVPADIINLP